MKFFRNEEEAVSPVIGVILMVAIVVILAAVIAAFVFGMAGTTSTTKNVAVTVTMTDTGIGAITIQGGADLDEVKAMMFSVDGAAFDGVFLASGTQTDETTVTSFTVGQLVYTGDPASATPAATSVIDGKRLILKTAFQDGSEQVILDRSF